MSNTKNQAAAPSPAVDEHSPELELAPYSMDEPEPTEEVATELAVSALSYVPEHSDSLAYVHVISWRPKAPFATCGADAGELVVQRSPDGKRVRVSVQVHGYPELSGSIDSGEARVLTQQLAAVFGWRLVK